MTWLGPGHGGRLVPLPTGVTLRVLECGPEEADEVVLFLHAVGGDATSWLPQLAALATRYRGVAVDLRGHGASAAPAATVSIAAFADDVAALVAALGYRRAHLAGLSMGGVVALETFRRHRAVVQSLALSNSWAFHPEGAARTAFIEGQLSRMSLAESSAELIPGLFAPGTPREVIDRAIAVEGGKDRDAFLASWRSMFEADLRPMLASIDVPVLLIGGSLDAVTPTSLLAPIAAAVPMSQLHEIPGAGHFSSLDHPGDWTRLLNVHLRRARATFPQRVDAPPARALALEADTAAHALMALLNARGVDFFFSNSGTDFTPILDALARYDGTPGFRLKTVATPHENTAIAMAHGYALLSGKPQAVMAHVNVGTANMGLGIINASRARVPMLVLAGKTPWYESDVDGCRTNFVQWGQDTFDQGAMFREFTKWDLELKGGRNLPTVVDRALAIARSEPAGPVYLTLPKEALTDRIEGGSFTVSSVARQQPDAPREPSAEAIDRAARLLAGARRPLVITAELGRTRGGPEALVALASRHAIGVIEHGKRNFFNFPTEHPMHLGFDPMPFAEEADLLLVVDSHVPWIPALGGPKEPPTVIQIGEDPLAARIPMRSFPVDLGVAGNAARALTLLAERLDTLGVDTGERAAHLAAAHARVFGNAREAARVDASRTAITKRYLSACLGDALDDRCVVFNEYDLDPYQVPRRVTDSWFENSIASGLGWSLGAALGAQLASPSRTMVVTLGDGSYLFNTPLSAHYVAAAYELPILIVVFNDTGWTTIRKSYLGTNPDGWAARKDVFPLCHFERTIAFEKVAESCGGAGWAVSDPTELPAALRKGLDIVRNERRHVLLNVICERG